jgi:hypothetical protein
MHSEARLDPGAWMTSWSCSTNERDIVVDPLILGELRFGILLLPKGKRRTRLEGWFNAGARRLDCLPWEAETGLRWASCSPAYVRLAAPCRSKIA